MSKMIEGKSEKNIENVCNFRYINEMVNGKKHLIIGIIDVFLNQFPKDILCINDAVTKKDYPIIKILAHTMMSSVSIMGISVLSPVLLEMENLGAAATDIVKIKQLNKKLNLICKQAIEEVEKEKLNYV